MPQRPLNNLVTRMDPSGLVAVGPDSAYPLGSGIPDGSGNTGGTGTSKVLQPPNCLDPSTNCGGLVPSICLPLVGCLAVGGIIKEPGKRGGEAGSGGDTVRVGRWMSRGEYDAMVSSGTVQEGSGGVSYVAFPTDPAIFQRQAPPGSLYVEFDVPVGSLRPTSGGAARIFGPNSFEARYAASKGPPVPQWPPATTIVVVTSK